MRHSATVLVAKSHVTFELNGWGCPPGRVSVALLRVDPAWDPLRRDPRFERMLARFDTTAPAGRR